MNNKINWWQILATVTITTLVAIISGMILYKWQNPSKSIVYKISPTVPFESESEKLNIYHLQIINDGNSEVEKINSLVKIRSGRIINHSIKAADNIKIDEKRDSTSLELNINDLNPNESINYSLLIKADSKILREPEILLRGKGVIGKSIEEKDKSKFPMPLLFLLVVAIGSILSSIFNLRFKNGSLKEESEEESKDVIKRRGDEQSDILSYACYMFDLKEEAEFFLKSENENIRYWTASEKLTYEAFQKNNKHHTNRVINVLKLILDSDKSNSSIADRSLGIINYNIAKLYAKLNQRAEYETFLKASQEITPKLVEKRLAFDDKMKKATNTW